MLQDCFHMTTFIQSNDKCPYINIIQILYNCTIQYTKIIYASLYVRISDSYQTLNCIRKYCTKITCRNLHNYTQSRFTLHHTLQHTHTIQHTKTFQCHPVICVKTYCMKKLSQSIELHTHFTSHCKLIIRNKLIQTKIKSYCEHVHIGHAISSPK